MALIVITSAGTLGDHLPYLALGQELQRRGHAVRMAFNAGMCGYARAAGLEVQECGPPGLDEFKARVAAADFDELHPDPRSPQDIAHLFRTVLRKRIATTWPDLLAACADADMLVCADQQQLLGPRVSARLKLPWVDASVMPALHAPHRPSSMGRKEGLSGILEVVTHECLVLEGLATTAPAPPVGRLLAASEAFCEPGVGPDRHLTGFWLYQADPAQQAVNQGLQRFLRDYPEPLVLSYSSNPLLQPAAELGVYAQAAGLLGKGLVVQSGWAGFHRDMLPPSVARDAVFMTGFIPQDALFAQASAVMHHGGIGTLARALRQGCPMVVAPHSNDQFYNARRVVELGVGAAIHPLKISPQGLAQVLTERVLSAETRQRASALAGRIRSEDGPAAAAGWLETWLTQSTPAQTTLPNHQH